MSRRFVIAAASAVAIAVLAAPFAQISAAQQRGAANSCAGQSPQATGNLQARQGSQQAHPTFQGGVRVASGDVNGAANTGAISARTQPSRSKEGGKDTIELESWSWGEKNAGASANCASAAAPAERVPRK